MNRWFAGLVFVGALVAGATTFGVTAQPVPTMSPMVTMSPVASATPMETMQP